MSPNTPLIQKYSSDHSEHIHYSEIVGRAFLPAPVLHKPSLVDAQGSHTWPDTPCGSSSGATTTPVLSSGRSLPSDRPLEALSTEGLGPLAAWAVFLARKLDKVPCVFFQWTVFLLQAEQLDSRQIHSKKKSKRKTTPQKN